MDEDGTTAFCPIGVAWHAEALSTRSLGVGPYKAIFISIQIIYYIYINIFK
jgi:hypothetical protein